MKPFIQRWVVTTLGVLVAANIVSGIRYDTVVGLVLASLLLGILNAFVRPIMIVLSLPLLIFTLGLFILVINAGLLYLVGAVLKTFHVDTFGAALLGALVISFTSFLGNWFLGPTETRIQVNRRRPPPRTPGNFGGRPPSSPPGGGSGGPIIDV
jgi:putative membrane protein